MGRPPKENKRDRQISIRLTDHELDEITTRAAAAAAGTTPTEFGRARMLASRTATVPTIAAAEAMHQDRLIEIQLRRLGNLLNQLVRHMHQTGEILPDAVSLLKELRTIITGRGVP
ncbi:plasmid mobilization protein [Bradyrhizobium sp. ERR14]|uniref:plasmid mobilization protein n=1 Tax=Bradyrhizobium sp. ERR14 TaxID=2663837 RepID=UPI0016094AB1|nr:hypothetical protein [Bradyrhizobium sp. ERR14]MBB4397939.1 beta-phosphoglucomutase-like phosphatase (HAD superfamily) [Bradyrhizobium sp. ERR14]